MRYQAALRPETVLPNPSRSEGDCGAVRSAPRLADQGGHSTTTVSGRDEGSVMAAVRAWVGGAMAAGGSSRRAARRPVRRSVRSQRAHQPPAAAGATKVAGAREPERIVEGVVERPGVRVVWVIDVRRPVVIRVRIVVVVAPILARDVVGIPAVRVLFGLAALLTFRSLRLLTVLSGIARGLDVAGGRAGALLVWFRGFRSRLGRRR